MAYWSSYMEKEMAFMEETKRVTGKKGFSLRDMVLCALFAAILAVSAWLTVPGEVPFTLQTFGVFAALSD